MLELKREPEVVFWVFVFPLLLAVGLGIAFRTKPGDASSLVIVQGSGEQEIQRFLLNSPQHASFKVDVQSEQAARKGFRLGKYDLAIEPDGIGGWKYLYDPARPESVIAKAAADDALQKAAGRKDVVATSTVVSSEPGSRYIDFLIPGLLGMNLMNSGMWGIGFALVDMRQRKLLKRFVGTPMRRSDFLLALMSSRLVLMILEIGLLLALGVLVFHMRVLGSVAAILFLGAVGAVAFRRNRFAHRQPRTKNRERKRPHESRNDAHVDFFRRLLFLRAISRGRATAHQSVAAYRPERRTSSQHSGRHAVGSSMATIAGAGSVGWNFVCACAALVSLDLEKGRERRREVSQA